MICPNCKARNPIGNKFCRECGEKLVLPEGSLAAEEAARVSAERDAEKYAAILVEAHALSDARKFDEAIVLGEEAALILPKSTSAYSLLATLYERTEQEQKAIAAMETVVALNPASEADKIKLDQLKRGVHVLPRHVPAASDTRLRESAPLPWMPLALAGVVTVSVLIAGLFWLNRSQKNRAIVPTTVSRPVSAPPVSAANPNGVAPEYVAPTPLYGGATVAAPPPPVSQVRPDPFAPVGGRPLSPQPTPAPRAVPGTTRRTSTPPPVAPVTVAPPPVSGTGTGTTPLPPISAGPPSSGPQSGSGSDSSAPGFGSGGRLPVAPPQQPPANGGGGNNNSPFPPGSPTGSINRGAGSGGGNAGSYIHISVGGAGSGSGNSSRPAASTQSPLSRARAFQQAGQYNEAIGAYRQAIASGSAAGSAYQNIAQCYESLGEPGGARSAYRDAIRAYETSGKGSPSGSALRGIASCKAALEVLGGG